MEEGTIKQLCKAEESMLKADQDVIKTHELKNDLESYIYDSRSKINDNFAPYVSVEEKESILATL